MDQERLQESFSWRDMKVKVKCTIVQALRLCTGRTAHRGSRGMALPFLDHGTQRGWGVSVTPQPLFTPGKDPVPIVQEAGWAPGLVWTGAENLTPPPRFDPWTVQPVASRYTNYATRPTRDMRSLLKFNVLLDIHVLVLQVIEGRFRNKCTFMWNCMPMGECN
jgi:hypothetical protein